VVPFPPEPKRRPRVAFHGGKAHAFTPPSSRRAEDRIRLAVAEQLPDGWEPLSGPLRLDVVAYVQMPQSVPKRRRDTALPARRPDAVNLAALACDALTGLVYIDDGQLVDVFARKRYGIPRWELTVSVVVEPSSHSRPYP
jgi:Holliday junction resolvase RusA-like endonuclease